MRLLVVGDTHGRDDWQEIQAKEDWDKMVFIGDYFDTHENISAAVQLYNFNEIIRFKRANKLEVELLLGNHDFHYLRDDQRYSGYQEVHRFDIREALEGAREELKMCYSYGDLLFTHAGVTKTWCKNNNIDITDIENSINQAYMFTPQCFNFRGVNMYGDDVTQSPIWVRPNSLSRDKVDGWTHVVGHTTQDRMIMMGAVKGVVLIDTLGTSGEYLICDKGKLQFKTL